MSLGIDTFFEVIAINPSAPKPSHYRWFGLDDAQFPSAKPHSWILSSDNLDEDLAKAKSLGLDLGTPTTQTRGGLTWRFAVREDGTIPLSGAAPMIMEWPDMPDHPAAKMMNLGAKINLVKIRTPHAEILNNLLNTLGNGNMPVEITVSPDTKLTATLNLNDGREVVLD